VPLPPNYTGLPPDDRSGKKSKLREWLATPVSPFAMDLEAMIRLFIAPLGTKEQLVATLEQVRDDAQEMLAFGGAVKQEFLDGRAVLQDQVYIRAMAVDSSSASSPPSTAGPSGRSRRSRNGRISPDGKDDRGLEIMAQLPAPTPGETTDRTRCRLEPSGDREPPDQAARTEADPATFRAAGERSASERDR